jgi:DNA-directed RNA polymerase II subunit RPB1
VWYQEIHSSRYVFGLESGPKYPSLGPEWDGSVPIPAILKPKPLWMGKQILSLAIPRGINIHRSPDPKSSHPVFDDGVLIENGELIFGIVEKKIVGASQGGLVHVVEKGPEATRQLFTGLQMIVNFWLFHNGFSIGIGDTIADHGTMSYITQNIAERKANVTQFIDDATHDRLKAAPGMTIRESFESLVEHQLNLAHDTLGQYAQKHLKEDNNVKQMVVAGSKGSFINISQMSVCVGQQSVDGRRIYPSISAIERCPISQRMISVQNLVALSKNPTSEVSRLKNFSSMPWRVVKD